MENFRDAAAAGEARGVLARVEDGAALAGRLANAFGDPEATRRVGREAARLVEENRGAADRTAAALAPLLPGLERGAAS
jgi:3-deoxy-D-manno-octulosonic-acid transferase